MSGTASARIAASSRTGRAKRGPSPSAKSSPSPIASGTVRMSENRIAASSGKRASGCSVTSVASSGFCASARKLPAFARVGVVLGKVAARLPHQPDRRVRRRLAPQRAQEGVVASMRHAAAARAGERASGEPLEDRKRRALRIVERGTRQVDRLLEHVLAGHRGVHHLVGEAQPRRAGREAARPAARSRAGTPCPPSRGRAG